jgi:hypothetical protein
MQMNKNSGNFVEARIHDEDTIQAVEGGLFGLVFQLMMSKGQSVSIFCFQGENRRRPPRGDTP